MSVNIIYALLGGIGTGIAVAVGGYLKSGDTTKQFDMANFVATVIEGLIFGGAAGILGVDYAQGQAYVYNTVGVFTIDYAKKTILRRVLPYLQKLKEKLA